MQLPYLPPETRDSVSLNFVKRLPMPDLFNRLKHAAPRHRQEANSKGTFFNIVYSLQ